MKKNLGTADRGIRFFVGAGIGVLYFTGQITGIVALMLGLVALALVATSYIGFCPAYQAIGISTRKASGHNRPM